MPTNVMKHQIRQQLISFFQQNPYPTDRQVHALAEQLGINKHLLEQQIYALLTDLLRRSSVGQPPWAPRWRKRMGLCPYQNSVGFVPPPQVKVGKHRNVPISQYDPQQLRMGVQVQREHTDNPQIASQIAKDHLAEIPDYYTRLLAMQQQAGLS